jgi:ubiquinone/menaquinone biosynthesis C-methylase UbiE
MLRKILNNCIKYFIKKEKDQFKKIYITSVLTRLIMLRKHPTLGFRSKSTINKKQNIEFKKFKKNHVLLDYGCGSLNYGIRYIKFLNAGNYIGADISKLIIYFGVIKYFFTIILKNPTIKNVDNLKYNNQKITHLICRHVLHHVPPNKIKRFLTHLKKVAPHAKYLIIVPLYNIETNKKKNKLTWYLSKKIFEKNIKKIFKNKNILIKSAKYKSATYYYID